MEPNFHLKVVSREGTLFDGSVYAITSFNEKGRFDVLTNHANFISLVNKALLIQEKENLSSKEIKFDNALMRVKANNVEVYIGIEGIGKTAGASADY